MVAQRLCMSENGFMVENVVYVKENEDQSGDETASEGRNGGGPASYIPAHTSPAAAASFRT